MKKIKELIEFIVLTAIIFGGMYAICLAGYLFN